MRLSVERINQNSPYWVIQLDDMTFRFVTSNGVKYRVGFYDDTLFLRGKAYHFYISNEENIYAPKDVKVFRVISLVLEEFFRQDASVMLYICDPRDHREVIRAKLYKRWFNGYKMKEQLTMKDVDVCFDGYMVYAGMILRNDNPQYQEIITAFDNFVARVPLIYEVHPK